MKVNLPLAQRVTAQSDESVSSAINRLAAQTLTAFDRINQLAEGVFIRSKLVSGQNKIYHGLNRVPSFWILCDINASSSIYRVTWDTESIILSSSAACEVLLCLN